jgi:hypothetical protein
VFRFRNLAKLARFARFKNPGDKWPQRDMAVASCRLLPVSNHINQLRLACVDAILKDNRPKVQSEIA